MITNTISLFMCFLHVWLQTQTSLAHKWKSYLRAGTKEKCAAVLGEKLRGLSSGLVPEKQK